VYELPGRKELKILERYITMAYSLEKIPP